MTTDLPDDSRPAEIPAPVTGVPVTPPAALPPKRGIDRRLLFAGGAVAAMLLGLGIAALARSQLPDSVTASGDRMQVEVNKPVMQPVPHSTDQLEVLPADMAAAATGVPGQPAPMPAEPLVSDGAAAEPDRPPPRASFDCAHARAGAEQMVCADPELAADDRELAGAYRRAMQLAPYPDEIRSEQRDWMEIREDAARRSPQALAGLYRQRIEDLNATADDAQR